MMRRFAILCLPVLALALPATALGLRAAASDGTLVVKNGTAPRGVAVVTLVINGTAIGHVSTGSPDQVDTVVIDDPNNANNIGASITNGAPSLTRKTISATETKFIGSDFRFRAADGVYKVWIYGSGVNVFAVGKGTVVLQGSPDPGAADGRYSLNGDDWHSLPAAPTDLLKITSSG
ncbi:MAG: hypothetical protein ACJ768_02930 [Gaiellaceae bacterium]